MSACLRLFRMPTPLRSYRGWTVRQLPSGNWQASVREAGKYIAETLPTEALATRWAKAKAAGVLIAKTEGKMPLGAPRVAQTERIAAAYLARLATKGNSPSYLSDAKLILNACAAAVPDLACPTAAADLTAWLGNIVSSGRGRGGKQVQVSPARRNKYRVIIRGMCSWACRQRPALLGDDPSANTDATSLPRFLKPHFSLPELHTLIRNVHGKAGRWVALMAYAGLCADEARCLRYGDIDWMGRCIVMRADCGAKLKRNRERIIPLQDELAMLLSPPDRPEVPIAGMGPGNLPRAFQGFLDAAGVPIQGRSAHSCRHTYAAIMVATGVPTSMVGSYLGHRVAQTTLAYVGLAPRYQTAVQDWKRGEMRLSF